MRRVVLISVAALVALVPVGAARADGDPASDYLLANPSFIPPDIGVPTAYATQLNGVLAAAKADGFQIRVALIGSRYDMGSVTVLYAQPARYAHFLGQELFFVYKGRLLVVMANGYGTSTGGKPTPAAQAIVDRLPRPAAGGGGLAAAATRAVVRLAAASGVTVAVPPLHGSTSRPSANHDRIEIAVGAAVLALLGAAGTFLWRRLPRGQKT